MTLVQIFVTDVCVTLIQGGLDSMTIELREYQEKQLEFLTSMASSSSNELFEVNCSLESPTGSGKSIVMMEFIKQLKAGIASLDEVIDTFSKPEMADKMGAEAAEQIRAHAEAMKAEGKKFCDCPACTQAREILKELGESIEEPEVGE